MKIALIAPPWLPVPPLSYGGTEAVIDRLAAGLQRAGHDVTLVAHPDSTCPVTRRTAVPAPAHGVIGDAATELAHALAAYELVGEADVVHDHTLAGPLVAARDLARPVVTTNHGLFDARLLEIYRRTATVVPVLAISHSQAATRQDVPVAAVIHHGIDVDAFPMGRGDGGYLLFLGRMSPDKGVHRAAAVARQAGERLLIAAKIREPGELAYFEAEVRPLLGRGVEFVGEVGGQDKLDLLAGARALLNPIRWPEPFGMVMLEALACGTPVVVSPLGAAPEIIEPGIAGYLAADDDEMVTALGKVLDLEREGCRAWAAEHFSTERMVDAHVAVYAGLREQWGAPVSG